jgi:hypothetical protein
MTRLGLGLGPEPELVSGHELETQADRAEIPRPLLFQKDSQKTLKGKMI